MALTHWFICTAAAGLACGGAMAQERARVLSAVPVVQQVGIPQQFCEDAQVYSGARTTGMGAVVGAIVGGVAGNALGHGDRYGPRGHYQGSNRGATTAVGAIAGGLIGHQVESANSPPDYQTVRRCTNETVYQNRTLGYDVTYEYAGRRYTTRLDHDPGPWMPISVQPQGRYSSNPAGAAQFVGPNGTYQSAPAGGVVTESITYSSPQPAIPVIVDIGGYPQRPPHGHRPPPPPPYYWR